HTKFVPGSLNALLTKNHFEFMKIFYRSCLWLLGFVLCSAAAIAQTTIEGTITDAASGDPVPGVNIVVKGKLAGTISNANGGFSLRTNDPPPFTLVFSYVGYQTQEVQITNQNTTGLSIKLQEGMLLGQ